MKSQSLFYFQNFHSHLTTCQLIITDFLCKSMCAKGALEENVETEPLKGNKGNQHLF